MSVHQSSAHSRPLILADVDRPDRSLWSGHGTWETRGFRRPLHGDRYGHLIAWPLQAAVERPPLLEGRRREGERGSLPRIGLRDSLYRLHVLVTQPTVR